MNQEDFLTLLRDPEAHTKLSEYLREQGAENCLTFFFLIDSYKTSISGESPNKSLSLSQEIAQQFLSGSNHKIPLPPNFFPEVRLINHQIQEGNINLDLFDKIYHHVLNMLLSTHFSDPTVIASFSEYLNNTHSSPHLRYRKSNPEQRRNFFYKGNKMTTTITTTTTPPNPTPNSSPTTTPTSISPTTTKICTARNSDGTTETGMMVPTKTSTGESLLLRHSRLGRVDSSQPDVGISLHSKSSDNFNERKSIPRLQITPSTSNRKISSPVLNTYVQDQNGNVTKFVEICTGGEMKQKKILFLMRSLECPIAVKFLETLSMVGPQLTKHLSLDVTLVVITTATLEKMNFFFDSFRPVSDHLFFFQDPSLFFFEIWGCKKNKGGFRKIQVGIIFLT
eukprot:TRINITY_DN9094_c0_g3_i9.p1 TRINITY_DN9094_c0_g3~~TRINITY_DN9094_c0_g3_i9.p1  ORF type:complete len:394 (+),score=73.03 TRINITY_DN9094_c0_g3_i9:73-1254(+)